MPCPPIIYIFFNRPELMRQSFAAIRAARPARLYLIADGPRPLNPADAERCAAARAYIESQLDWPCEVTRDYSEVNLGCGRRIRSGLTAAFALLGEAIVIEDDILPHPDFFPFCAGFLARYRNQPEVHSICGFNPVGKFFPDERQCIPSRVNSIWGWASWQRAWQSYRSDFAGWDDPSTREALRAFICNDLHFQNEALGFDKVFSGQLDTWDYQWTYTLFVDRRVALVSPVNLITNLGFLPDATHTTHDKPSHLRTLRSYPLPGKIEGPASLDPDPVYDHVAPLIAQTASIPKIAALRTLCRSYRPLARRLFRK
ncbi:MAG TPA: glycosyltransferase family 2 protein [Chthoniobacterales bacterium]